jgi:hypothetical protein
MSRRTTHELGESGSPDEEQIRADERAKVERELASIEAERRAVPNDPRYGANDPRSVPNDPRYGAAPVGQTVDERHQVTEERDDVVLDRDDRVERAHEVEVVRKRAFSLGQMISLLVGAALVVLGVFALVATGLETPLDQPVESVMGYDHTPLLGILEVVAGGLLVLFSLRPGGRWLVAAVGLALVAGGILIAADLDWTANELAAETGYAWIPIVAGGVALLAAILTPRRYQRMSGVPVDERV